MKKLLLIAMLASFANADFLTDWWGDKIQVNIVKTVKGFTITPKKDKTQYKSRIIWGENWIDHNTSSGVVGMAVTVTGNGWSYTTVTDDNGYFIVPVKPNSPFTLKASSGDEWCEYNGTIAGIPRGTTGE